MLKINTSMCYYTEIRKDAKFITKKFKKTFKEPELFTPSEQINGFALPKTPVITIENPDEIEMIKTKMGQRYGLNF